MIENDEREPVNLPDELPSQIVGEDFLLRLEFLFFYCSEHDSIKSRSSFVEH
jgi:hypothetical protein